MQTFWQYWKMVWNKATAQSSKQLGGWVRIVSIVIPAFSNAMASYFRGANLMDNLISGSMGAIIGLVAWWGIWLIFSVINSFREPVLMHNNQEAVVQSYKDNWGMTEVPADKLELFGDSDLVEKKAVVVVTNNETAHAIKCYATLKMALINDGDGWKNRTSDVNKKAQGGKFPWYEHGANSEWDVLKGTTEKLGIASLGGDGRIMFNFGSRGHNIDNVNASIYIEVLFRGDMQASDMAKKPIEPKTFSGFIVRKKDTIYLERGERPSML